jgi:hypothetical protein
VQGAVANAKLLVGGDANAGVELARTSLRMGPANPLAWDCLSLALLSSGALEEAHRHQMTANAIAARLPIRHFWDMGECLTSIVTGRHEQARRLEQSARAILAAFRPTLRYLTALAGARLNNVNGIGQRGFTPKFWRRSVPVSHRTASGSSVAPFIFRASAL